MSKISLYYLVSKAFAPRKNARKSYSFVVPAVNFLAERYPSSTYTAYNTTFAYNKKEAAARFRTRYKDERIEEREVL
jgi:hypothetical protein